MHFNNLLAVVITIISTVSANPLRYPSEDSSEARSGECTSPLVRKEWRTLNPLEKENYLLSIKCMMHSPPKLSATFPAVKTRWEDFISYHQSKTPTIHYVAQFLPWHRYFLHKFERALREECFYFGAIPYWDETLDWSNITASPIFDTTTGFGGNGAYDPTIIQTFGSSGGGCIQDGIFADEKFHVKVGADMTPGANRCITRNNLHSVVTNWLTPEHQAVTLSQKGFTVFAPYLEGNADLTTVMGMHDAGHVAVGGDLRNMYTSPTDPVFYLHHANIDRLWTEWQAADPSARLFDVGGPLAPRIKVVPQIGPAQTGNLTLDYKIEIGPLIDDVLTSQILDTKGSSPAGTPAGVLCYNYA